MNKKFAKLELMITGVTKDLIDLQNEVNIVNKTNPLLRQDSDLSLISDD
jgi:hypothetical protein